ncbi:hypothetical protein CAPTEDRAFT_179325 [Capitella teleta]|uniref:Cilia- and flagella-associated protein 298 n=1 Tax=Capitella teleta TaxID=283909 RepID=R7TPC8_CAPTE|nr:hypothetical protein CAPTEDRAFT_179325 [Capitella teleta]|eukprot:ELT95417.1 hypothetical protein CAPTEDRAFT_179325 [Capitella teleta]
MVKLNVKKGDEAQFLYDTTVAISMDDLLEELLPIYNGRLKVSRICGEMEQLAQHGITMPPNMQGLTDEQIEELKLKDEWADKCEPSGGHVFVKDDIGRRNGRAPKDNMAEVLNKTIKEAKDMISNKNVQMNKCLTFAIVQEALDILRGAVTIVYPMGLPPHDPIRAEFENTEDLSGMQASQEVIELDRAALWWAGKEMVRGKKLCDFIGKNEKTKIVCKLQKKGLGAPAREPVVSQDEQKAMMAHYYRKQEEMKKLDQDAEDSYLNADWADNSSLRRQFQGVNDIMFKPGKKL